MPTRIKICGITRVEDALVAAEAGAHAIGLVFYPRSPRVVTLPVAKTIVAALPPFISKVGLFVNATLDEINPVLAELSLDCLQFHGDETPAFCQQFSRPYIKGIRMLPGINLHAEVPRYATACGVLLDTYDPSLYGGTGHSFDWSLIPPDLPKPVILAGGLTPDNVAAAIRQVHPYAVDVSGGVEASKGIKDHARIRAFIHEVRSLDGS
ncbi:MAG: phosphoribosylanthranilate isomerase [Gammaproteobacteria bacterium]|nr:phosphoribosylanthranilate isomerase [Gammaproteobacteria bacterium]